MHLLWQSDSNFHGYCDTNMPRDVDTRKSTYVYIYTLVKRAISWCHCCNRSLHSLLQKLSIYILGTEASEEAIWSTLLCSELGLPKQIPVLHCLAKNPVYHATIIYIDICNHVNSEVIEDGQMQLVNIDTADNLTDCLTKCLSKTLHNTALSEWELSSRVT